VEAIGEQILARKGAEEKADIFTSPERLGYERRVKDDVQRQGVDERIDIACLYGEAQGMGRHRR
jgi:hypothetical protein